MRVCSRRVRVEKAGFSDKDYKDAGVEIVKTAAALWKAADVVAKVRPPTEAEMKRLREGQTLISFFNPGGNEAQMKAAAKKGATVIAMEMVPRISRAQKMDALSSMANIAGYRAVIEAGNNFGRFFTGQITAAGKVPPAKVLVVGAGVAGLAAIGTSTSLGAITYAFDVRPEVAEQVESMGAEFVYLDFEEEAQDGAATGGYAAVSQPRIPRGTAGQVPRAGAGDGYRDHHGADPEPRGAGALDRGHGQVDETGLGHRRPGGGEGRQLQADGDGREDRDRQWRDDHRLYRFPQPDGDAELDALRHQYPAPDGGSDAGERRRDRA